LSASEFSTIFNGEEGLTLSNKILFYYILTLPSRHWRVAPTVLTDKHRVAFARLFVAALGLFCSAIINVFPLFAGPPFRTDDPETVQYRHWEFYVATQYANDKEGVSGTAPHLEVNYGVAPNVQLHLIVPAAFDKPRGAPTLYGPGDLEIGVKYRFIQEDEYCPMVGTFPILHLPTGNQNRGLGNGDSQLFLPIWLQKSWGPWTSYGGGGYWLNPGTDNQNYWYAGWQIQREIAKWLTVGGEVFYQTPPTRDGEYQTGYNLGAIVNFTDNHHFIFSAGTDVHGPNLFSFYAAYLLTWGPPEK
jgi:hypothetical protein